MIKTLYNLTLYCNFFYNFEDVILAYKQSIINLHTFVWVRYTGTDIDLNKQLENQNFIEKRFSDRTLLLTPEFQIKKDLNGNYMQTYIKTTPGRILLNKAFEYTK